MNSNAPQQGASEAADSFSVDAFPSNLLEEGHTLGARLLLGLGGRGGWPGPGRCDPQAALLEETGLPFTVPRETQAKSHLAGPSVFTLNTFLNRRTIRDTHQGSSTWY